MRCHKAAFLRSQHPDWREERSKQRFARSSPMLEPDLIELFAEPLNQSGIRNLIIGNVACMLYGERMAASVCLGHRSFPSSPTRVAVSSCCQPVGIVTTQMEMAPSLCEPKITRSPLRSHPTSG